MMRALLRLHIVGATGLVLFIAGLLQYRSYEQRPVLGLWSYPYFAVIVCAALVLLVVLIRMWPNAKAIDEPMPRSKLWRSTLLDFAVLSWGLGFLMSALDDPEHAGRITDLVLLGSVLPVAALLEWLALCLVVIAAGLYLASRMSAKQANLALVFGSIVATFLLAEGGIRLKVGLAPATRGFPTYSGEQWVDRYAAFNSEGFRDGDHALAAPPDVRRVLVVGDSFAFGIGIDRPEDRFGEQLASLLEEETGETWQSINASRGGSNTKEHLSFLDRGLAYAPDAVVLLYVFNDIEYLQPLEQRGDSARAPGSIFDRLRPFRLLYNNSYLFQEIYAHIRLIGIGSAEGDSQDPYLDDSLLSTHIEDIAQFATTAAENGVTAAIVPFDHTILLNDANQARYRRFVQAATAAGLPVWPMFDTFAGYSLEELTVNKLDAHPNERAHRLAAAATAERLLQSLER